LVAAEAEVKTENVFPFAIFSTVKQFQFSKIYSVLSSGHFLLVNKKKEDKHATSDTSFAFYSSFILPLEPLITL